MDDKYIPLACGLYDKLEAVSVLRKLCEIIYINEKAEKVQVTRVISDIRSVDKAEYLFLDDSTTIRLDKIISVNGEPFSAGQC